MKRVVSLAILLLIQQEISSYFVWGQTCFGALRRGSDPSDPPFNDDGNRALDANNSVQAIITTYEFLDVQYCDCVSITSWEAFVQPSSGRNRDYDITFQVWRPSPTNSDCYSLVGQNAFTSIGLSRGEWVRLIPTQAQYIIARPGDVLGYYTNSRGRANEGIQLDRSNDYNQNIIWYLQLGGSLPTFAGTSNNFASIGANGYLTSSTNAAPAIKISTSTISCPPSLPSMAASFTCPPAVQSSSPQFLSSTITAEPSSSAMSETRESPSAIASTSIIAISRSNVNPLPQETTAIISTPMPSSLQLLATRAFRLSSSFIESNSEASSFVSNEKESPMLTSLAVAVVKTTYPVLVSVQANSKSVSSLASTVETSSVLTTSLVLSALVSSPVSTAETNSVLTSSLGSSTFVSPYSSLRSSPQESIMPLTTSRDFSSSIQITSNYVITTLAEAARTEIQPPSTQNLAPYQSNAPTHSSRHFSLTESYFSTSTVIGTESTRSSQISVSIIAAMVVIVVLLTILACISVLIFVLMRRIRLLKKVKLDKTALELPSNSKNVSLQSTQNIENESEVIENTSSTNMSNMIKEQAMTTNIAYGAIKRVEEEDYEDIDNTYY